MSQRERRIARVAGEGAAARAKQGRCGSPRKKAERDFIMNAQQAKEYGIVDDIIFKHK